MSYTKLSRFLSLILRHKPEVIGMTLDKHGWVNVAELLEKLPERYACTMEILEEIVAADSKGRYSFNEDKTLIRANQGHSIWVDVGLKRAVPPEYLYHGTGEKYEASIDQQGLMKQNRLYVHLSLDTQTASAVGKRHGKLVLYRVHSGKMAKDGFAFFLSENGVWLTDYVPASYLEKL